LAATDGSLLRPIMGFRQVDSWSEEIGRQVPIYRSIHGAIAIMTAYELLGDAD
jgi:hypothetical protein